MEKKRPISIGKLRGLQRISNSSGTFACLAIDHRQNLRKALNPSAPALVSDEELSGFKLDVARNLANEATAVLLDPEFSAAQAVATGIIPKQVGLVVAVESTGYGGEAKARLGKILPGWSVEKAKRMGADAVKLLVYFHPDSPTAPMIEDFTEQVAEECLKYDLCMMLEPLSYSLEPGGAITSEEKRYVIAEAICRLVSPGVDVIKIEFPLASACTDESQWAEVCKEVSSLSTVPWILLSAAVDFETYLRQATIACQEGASGIAVGRAVWQEAVALASPEREEFLHATALPRLHRLATLCRDSARPWTEFYYAQPSFDWYKVY
jgi:tagatose 1,6-diphosphate aldolase